MAIGGTSAPYPLLPIHSKMRIKMAKSQKQRTPSVHVVLDTNVLFTEAEDKLLCKEIGDLISLETKDLGLEIIWHMPSVVKLERRAQMLERALRLLIPLSKLENLLGHRLNMTPEIVETRVDDAISRQMSLHNLSELHLDEQLVDWKDLISRAASRSPPFSPTGGEKGFKDSIVVESFCQLAAKLPKSTSRVVLLSSDDLVLSATRHRISNQANASVAQDIASLKTLLNAVASHLSDEAVSKILPRATSLVFAKTDDKSSLWFKWNLSDKFTVDGVHASRILSGDGFKTKYQNISQLKTLFAKKSGQRVFFQTVVIYNLEATRPVKVSEKIPIDILREKFLSDSADSDTSKPIGITYSMMNDMFKIRQPASKNTPESPILEEWSKAGSVTFYVNWSATLTSRGSLIKPQLDNIEHKSTVWTEPKMKVVS